MHGKKKRPLRRAFSLQHKLKLFLEEGKGNNHSLQRFPTN